MRLSATLVKDYKRCRRGYQLRYIEQIQPLSTSTALQDGLSYHNGIEHFYNTGEVLYDADKPSISAMIAAYVKYIAPHFEVKCAEKWFDCRLSDKHNVIGRNDAIAADGLMVEHKTTSKDVDDEYIYELQWDEQILTYMLANDVTEMWYTVCKKPTIRQRQTETSEEFYQRCLDWYAEDTDRKIRVIRVTRSPSDIEEHRLNLIQIADEIENCTAFYRNPCACMMYNRRCEYAPICLNYSPELEYVGFTKKDRS